MTNAGNTNIVSMSQDSLRFSHLPIVLFDFHSRSGGIFLFSLWIITRCLSEENAGRSWMVQKSTWEFRFSCSSDPCDLTILLAAWVERFPFASVSGGSSQSSVVLMVDHMNQCTQSSLHVGNCTSQLSARSRPAGPGCMVQGCRY